MTIDDKAPLDRLVEVVRSRQPLATGTSGPWTWDALQPGRALYANRNARLKIDFIVERLAFPSIQTLDLRVVRIAPASNNELHRHAHESVFVVMEGFGEVLVGEKWYPLSKDEVAFVPRWVFHQTRNGSDTDELVVLAITDFGFTSAVLGDYDRRTRLAMGGSDAGGRQEP